jgi:DNA ligase-1
MAKYGILKALEHDKLSAATKKKYPTEQALYEAGWWLQPKYDGCFGMAYIGTDNDRMLSRTGEDYTKSCGHILKELKDAMIDHYGVDFAPRVFLGEVWQPIDEAAFPAISGKFRRQRPSPELRFMVNDMLPVGLETLRPWSLRIWDLCEILGHEEFAPPQARAFPVYRGHRWAEGSIDSARGYALQLQGAGGFDGAILRDPDAGYSIAEAKLGEIVKVKPTLSLDLKIVEMTETVGEKTKRPVYTIGVVYKGEVSEVGSGMPHNLPKDLVCVAIVEIECLGITADGKLREPRFKGVRHDKLEAD